MVEMSEFHVGSIWFKKIYFSREYIPYVQIHYDAQHLL